MPINFEKRSSSKGTEKKTHPREIYDALDRHANKGPLRVPVQSTVLDNWFDNYKDQRDVIIKLPTGEGKTLIGLLILQSKINQKKGASLYICPNKYLADQVRIQADEFGIQHCAINENGLPEDFINGEKILITHAQMVFNGRSSNFGIGLDSVDVENFLLDDAHSCIEIIKTGSKFKIPRSSECFNELLHLFGEELKKQGAGTYADICNESKSAILAVPYWDWEGKQDEVVQILSKYNKNMDKSVWFVWNLLKDNLKHCSAVFSGKGIEISPRLLPMDMFGSFFNASHRVFMSATISNDSFFIRDLGLTKEVIENPLTFEKTWSGEKMVLIPSLIDGSLTRENIVNWVGKWRNTQYGVVAIAPSNWHTKIWDSLGATTVDAENLLTEVDKLKQGQFPNPVVMAAKYDGIDLPDNMCRVLVIDSLPITETITEKYIESCIPNSTFTQIKTAQTIEQGLGRAVRGEKDYCIILLLGNDLVKQIRYKGSRPYLSPQTRKQIDIGLELAKYAREDKDDSQTYTQMLTSVINQGLGRDESWKQFYIDSMNSIDVDECRVTSGSDEMLILERKAECFHAEGKHDKAINTIQSLLDNRSINLSQEERGWYLQEMSRYLYAQNRVEGMAMQVNAHRTNKRLFLPPDGYQFTKIDLKAHERISNIKSFIGQYDDFEDFLVYMDDVFSRLVFGVKAERFESAIDELGRFLGFNTERPDANWKSGPDNLWAIKSGEYLFIECKSEVKLTRSEILKEETGQFNNNIAWFKRFYPGANVIYSMIIPTKKVKSNTGFNESVVVLRERGLKSLVSNARAFVLSFKSSDLRSLSDTVIHQSIHQYKLDADELVDNYFEQTLLVH
ncbi:helicase C-terminal domain-containing protein [Vibrio kanaloae]|uniref:helicase C-terminal domain-containing protein n=1 Tax=Vibrio kanaloae TaxID=170673 RepID=UPI001244F3DB|nr:helicase C-terminal domain-containing protein [Vibrio kanaloae]KAB0457883.1 DEAD/DEAH box helicase [Vibrio kanaloae]